MKAQPCVARVISLPSSTVDRSIGEDNIIMFLTNFVYVGNVTSIQTSVVLVRPCTFSFSFSNYAQ